MAGVGLETRTTILPSPSVPQNVPGIFGPDYSFADNIKLPGQVGVRDGGELSDVIDSVKAMGYYVDMIGFGESSSPLSRGLGVQALGVNTWLETGFQCSNGANAWAYSSSIPTGNGLGKRVAAGLESAGLPRLRGLAPGIVEDAQSALDPFPIIGAIFGSGYPSCRFVVKPVGDQDGSPINLATSNYYVNNPETLLTQDGRKYPLKKPDGTPNNAPAFQGRWVQDGDLSQEEWTNAPKIYNPDGTPKAQGFCGGPEGSEGSTPRLIMISFIILGTIIIVGTLGKRKI